MAEFRQKLTRWLLLDGNRFVIATLHVVGTFLLLVLLGRAGILDVQNSEAVRGVATGFIPGLVAFLSIVLGINQLVLSQEFASAGEVRDRIQNVREYRHDVEEMAGTGPSPVLPVGFLSFVVRTIQIEAASLEESVGPETDPAVREEIKTYARTVTDEAEQAHESLERLQPGRINALLPVLEYDDSYQLYEARRFQHDHEHALSSEIRQSLSRLIEVLELFSVARTQFRTTYTQRVLARLSRQLLYVGIPALVVVIVLGLMPTSPRLLVSEQARLVTVSALLSIALSPLAVLSAYLLRVAAVSERTIAVGPFVSRPGEARNGSDPESGEKATGGDPSSTDIPEQHEQA